MTVIDAPDSKISAMKEVDNMTYVRKETIGSFTKSKLLQMVKDNLDELGIAYEEKPGGFGDGLFLDQSIWSTRLCTVNGEAGYLHTWEHYSKPLPASPLMGGEPAGVFSKVFGIVEFKDGVRRVDPTDIIFRDEENAMLNEIDKVMK